MSVYSSFNTSKNDFLLVSQIVQRYLDISNLNQQLKINIIIDVELCHFKSPLMLLELLASRDEDIINDIGGILRNINRITGFLENCFLPRYLKKI